MSNVTREELRTVEVFHDLPDEQLDWFLEHATEVRMQPGEIYVRAGDIADKMIVVLQGNSAFNITLGAAAKLAFTTQPGGGTGGTAWTTQPVVTVQDAGGNTVTTDASTVTVAIGTNAGPGGVLSGTLTKAAVAGVASFSGLGLKIDLIGTGYTLAATDGGLTSATSSAFNITDPK